jgi:cytoskeletal protein CcmA (bactofilin family)
MWKSNAPQPPAPTPTATPATPEKKELRPMEGMRQDSFRSNSQDVAHIGKSVLIKGELSGSEDLYLDGEVEGSIDLQDHSLTIGPHGRVRANVIARDVVVHGKVDGNVQGTERVELKRSAVLMGDIATQRIVIEDGAYFKGAIDIKKEAKPVAKAETPKSYAAAAAAPSSFTPQS